MIDITPSARRAPAGIAVAAIATLLLLLAAAASSARSVEIRGAGVATAGQPVKVVAVPSGTPRQVTFEIDGRTARRATRAPYRLDVRSLAAGTHKVRVTATFGRRRAASASVKLKVVSRRPRTKKRPPVVVVPIPTPTPTEPAPTPTEPAPTPTQPAPTPTEPAPTPTQPAPTPTQPAPTPTEPAPTPTQPAPTPTEPAPAPAPTGTLLFTDRFAQSSLSGWQLIQRAATDRIRTVASPDGSGATVSRFEVRNGDRVGGDTDSRAELGYTANMAREGDELVYSWRSMLASDYPGSSTDWAVLGQWKNEGTGSPPLQIGASKGVISVIGGQQVNYKTLWSTRLVRSQWLDFRARIKFSSDPSKGWIDVWHNGVKVLDHYRAATLYSGMANYFKLGLYRSKSIVATGVVYHRDVKISRI